MTTTASSGSTLLSGLSKLATACALGGLLLFLGAGTLARYKLSPGQLATLGNDATLAAGHRQAVLAELKALQGIDYGSVFSFVSAVDGALAKADAGLKGTIGDYQRGVYAYQLTRLASHGFAPENATLLFYLTFVLIALSGILVFGLRSYQEPPGIKNKGVMRSSFKARGYLGIAFGVVLISFYLLLYFYPAYIVNWVRLADPLSMALKGRPADRWFFYGSLYTFAVVVMGLRFIVHYRHSRYHLVRTGSVIFFQLGFAFLLPALMEALNSPSADLKLAWPLDYSFFYGYHLDALKGEGTIGWVLLLWGIALSFIVVPALAAFFGKRWYCSWVCGCGGLAETLGDPFRQLSDKRLRAWQIERWLIHTVLLLAVLMTGVVVANYLSGGSNGGFLAAHTWKVQKWYGFLIGSIFSGVVGTGFYPLMGNRVWCRFGCPLAAILGLVQRFKSRFRITINGGQCISCGNCSTYCEMGIDVRWYAQRGQNVVRASCVGCGICAAVCPRGVLRLENGPLAGRNNTKSLAQLANGPIDGPASE